MRGERESLDQFKKAVKGLEGKYGEYKLRIKFDDVVGDAFNRHDRITIEGSHRWFKYVPAQKNEWPNGRLGEKILLVETRYDVYKYAARHEFGHLLGFTHKQNETVSLMSYAKETMRFSNSEVERLHNVYK